MTHKTKGVVLRTVKYGESSLIVTMFTEHFGLQTYMVNGVRTTKQSAQKANYFQPAAILEMVVYHSDQKSMQRIKEFKWAYLYEQVQHHIIKNTVALYMVELLYKCLKQPEKHEALFYFFEDVLVQLDQASRTTAANLSLFFALQLPYFLGFKIDTQRNILHTILDLKEGIFTAERPSHPYFIEGEPALLTSQLLKAMHPEELDQFKLNREIRRVLLTSYQDYYAIHIQDFGQMKTLLILHEVLSQD